MKITAHATRSGAWWAISFTTPAGERFTQARRLDQVEDAVRDICTMDAIDVTEVTVAPDVDKDTARLLEDYHDATQTYAEASERAAAASRRAAATLRSQGLTVRDVVSLMGVSAQRVSQLVA